MLIGGGTGRSDVSVRKPRDEDEEYLTLVDKDAPSNGLQNVITGGPLGKFPARTVVALDALKARRAFFRDGALSSEWESEQSAARSLRSGARAPDRRSGERQARGSWR